MALRSSTGLVNGIAGTQCFKTFMANGIVECRTGLQPATADEAETGTLLIRFTLDHLAFIPGAPGNGLEFGTPVAGVIAKAVSEVWSGLGLATGVAGWYRFYDNNYITGASTTAIRFDGQCASSGSQFNMSSTNVALNAPITIDSCQYTFPKGA